MNSELFLMNTFDDIKHRMRKYTHFKLIDPANLSFGFSNFLLLREDTVDQDQYFNRHVIY